MDPVETMEETTVDAFHRGAFHVVQPGRRGHRAGIDAMLLAAAVPAGFSGRLADLGAGAGAAGFAVATRCPGASVTLVDRAPEMIACAREGLTLEGNAHLRDRIAIMQADVSLSGKARAASGLEDRSHDFVLMNPPFNAASDRATPDPLRRLAHVMDDDLFECWLKTAAAIVAPRGRLALIARPVSLPAIMAAMAGRFGSAEVLAVHPRADADAIRIVLRARFGARGGMNLRPALVLHERVNAFTERAEAVINGRATLFDD